VAEQQQRPLTRTAAYSVLAFVVLFVVAFVILGVMSTPQYDVPDQEWIEWYEDSGNRVGSLVAGMIMVLGALALIVFAASFSELLRARSANAFVAPVVLALGTVAGAFIVIGTLLLIGIATALTFAPDFDVPAADLLQTVEQLGFVLWLLGGGWASALFVGALSFGARGTDLLPGWLVTAGFVVAALLLLSFFFFPFLLLPVWGLVVGIYLLRR
jgi:hypothetical protein